MDEIQKAMKKIDSSKKKALNDPYRPQYHFLAPANWMNDPNGTIYYKGEFHLFYQFNPFNTRWGSIHWGHAKSKDLIHWEHLPIALYPSKDQGEKHCFSGCCVIKDGVPTIIYSSIGFITDVAFGSEQWMATSDEKMIEWIKYPKNPIITKKAFGTLETRHVRDPYIWKEDNKWYLITGGHIKGGDGGSIFLFESKDLLNWNYIHPLISGTKEQGWNWECPNLFPLGPLGSKHILIISPHKNVIYAVGDYDKITMEFKADYWKDMDLAKKYYATNTLIDEKGRLIVLAWIRKGGTKGWNGLISLPRVLSWVNNEVRIEPLPELNNLSSQNIHFENLTLNNEKQKLDGIHDSCVEIMAEFSSIKSEKIGIILNDGNSELYIGYDLETRELYVGNEKGIIDSVKPGSDIDFHIFIDRSVIEVFLNASECITTRFYPKFDKNKSIKIDYFAFVSQGNAIIKKGNIWTLKSIELK